MIAGTHSGVGKTTVATGIMAALRESGLEVAAAKVGPDFIDPGYHSVATGRPGRNLDSWICGIDAMVPLALRASRGAQILVVEGVMGLFDGAGSTRGASTAEIAIALEAPVVLVVDASGMSSSVAALVSGFASFDRRISLAGVVLNRVGSDRHEEVLREALAGVAGAHGAPGAHGTHGAHGTDGAHGAVPVLGVLRRDDRLSWRDRHLGLVPVIEQPEAVRRSVSLLASAVRSGVDLPSIEKVARAAPPLPGNEPARARRSGTAVVAVVGGPAFGFVYEDNLERLEEAGAELVGVDPAADESLPPGADALYAGGGFPQVHAGSLADNEPLMADVRRRVGGGLVTWAECGGMLWLARSLDGRAMCGVLPTDATMSQKLSLGYRRATVLGDNPLAASGTVLRGHEFHYSSVDPEGDAFRLEGGEAAHMGGWSGSSLSASYLHLHLGSDPGPAERFVATAARSAAERARRRHAGLAH